MQLRDGVEPQRAEELGSNPTALVGCIVSQAVQDALPIQLALKVI